MKKTFLSRVAAVVASAGLVAGLGACSNNESGDTNAASGDKDTIKVVASTKVWADVADAVTDDAKVSIEPIISSNDTDPHSYQPSAADMAKVEGADILLAGGGDYDAWLTSSLEKKDGKTIISALALDDHAHEHEGHDGHDHATKGDAHDHDHAAEGHDEHHHHDGEPNEHVWYDTEKVDEVAHQLADALKNKGAEAATDKVHDQLHEIDDLKAKIKDAKVAQVHPLADDVIKDTKIKDITPKGYRSATLNESEPAAADVNDMIKLVESGDLSFLIDAPQTHDQVSERIVEAAKAKGVKIINVYESPSKDQTFFELYKQTLKDMENA